VQKINYDKSYPFVRPAGKQYRCLLVAEEDSAVFLLAVDKSSPAHYSVGLVCITGESDARPAYVSVLSASGPDLAFEGTTRNQQSHRKHMLGSSVSNDLGNMPYLDGVMCVNQGLLHREFKEIRLRFSILRFPGK
jgi:hypothetical protein